MLPDGSYVRDEGGEGTSSQEALYRYFSVRKVSAEEPEPEPAPEPVPAEPEPAPETGTAEPEKPLRGFRGWLKSLIH
jgi:polyphosphate kinase